MYCFRPEPESDALQVSWPRDDEPDKVCPCRSETFTPETTGFVRSTSTAPMSHGFRRPYPRWSLPEIGAEAQTVALPPSMSALPATSFGLRVFVGPPLSANVDGLK